MADPSIEKQLEELERQGSESVKAAFLGCIRQHGADLLPALADTVSLPESDVRARVEAVVGLESAAAHGMTITHEEKRYEVYVTSALMMLLFKTAKVVASQLRVEAGEVVIGGTVPRQDAVRAVLSLLDAHWLRDCRASETISVTEMTSTELHIAGRLLTTMERFIVAHELGHVAMNFPTQHDAFSPTVEALARRALREECAKHPQQYAVTTEAEGPLVAAWTRELMADHIGTDLMLRKSSRFVTALGEDLEHAYVGIGIDLYFLLLTMVDVHDALRSRRLQPLGEHPPPAARRERLGMHLESCGAPTRWRDVVPAGLVLTEVWGEILQVKGKVP